MAVELFDLGKAEHVAQVEQVARIASRFLDGDISRWVNRGVDGVGLL